LTLYSTLAKEQPAEFRDDLAGIYSDIGSALEFRGDIPGALEYHRKALAICEQLAAANPKYADARFRLAGTYQMIGRALAQSSDGQVKEALENNAKALALCESLVTEEPTNAAYRRGLAIAWQYDGDYRSYLKDFRGALESFRKKYAIDEESVAADPADARARYDLAYAGQRIGDLLAELGKYAETPPYYHRALEMYEKGVAADPSDVTTPIRAIIVRGHLAKAEAEMGDLESARQECTRAAQLVRSTVDVPAITNRRRLRSIAFEGVGDAFAVLAIDKATQPAMAIQNWRVAREMYQDSVDIAQKLRAANLLDQGELDELADTVRKIADCDKALRH
jgi:tetratricopeptide (TPR) repeat protein